MFRLLQKSKSSVILSLIFLGGTIYSIYLAFFSPQASLSFSSLKWYFVVIGYFLIQALLLAHQIYHDNDKLSKLPLPGWWNTNKIFQFITLYVFIVSLGFLLRLPSLALLITNTLNSIWLNFPIALFLTLVIKVLSFEGIAGKMDLFDLLNAFFLYLGLFIAAPFLSFYPVISGSVIMGTAMIVILAYSEFQITRNAIEFINLKCRQNILLTIILIYAIIFFLNNSIHGMFTSPSIMDEGSYSFKGYLFAIGEYFPYQDYGPWTNKMPLSFMIPGWIQQFFGPSLISIRVAALVMQVIIFGSLFILGRRFFGYFGAVIAVSLFAFNPELPSFYSQGNTQIISAFLISLILVFTLGKDRKPISLLVGNLIAGILILARENMAPFVVFLDLYLIWEHGWKKAIPSIFTGAGVFILGHLFYWPGILKIWAKWMPEEITPFLDEFRKKSGGKLMWNKDGRNTDLITSLGSLTQGISSNIVNMLAAFALPWLIKPWRELSKHGLFKSYFFLLGSTIFLTIIHAMVTLNDGTCVYCFSSYLSFFTPIPITLLIISIRVLAEQPSKFNIVIYISLIGVFFVSKWFESRQALRWLTQIKITSIHNQSGFQFLSDVIQQNFRIDYESSKILVPVSAGIFAFVLFMLILHWVKMRFTFSFLSARFLPQGLLAFGAMLPMITNLGFFYSKPAACESNIPSDYAAATRTVDALIEDGSKVYWLGESTAILLGLDNQFYPQQFNEGFSFKVGSVDDLAAQYGFWNENLAKQWSEETDYMLIEENKMNNPILLNVDFSHFQEIGQTPLVNGCDPSSYYHVYENIK